MMDSRTSLLAATALVAAFSSGAFAASNAVIDANAAAGVAATKACIAPSDNPFHESHAYAMMHLAIHDALNAIDRKYEPYAYDQKADLGTSPDAAWRQRHTMFWFRSSSNFLLIFSKQDA
jgi:hypothetical protein